MIPRQRMILCVGLPRSASTWVFNVVAEIERSAARRRKLSAFYADGLDDSAEAELASADIAVIKSHRPDASFRFLAAHCGVPVLLSVRDPLDAVASSMQRFAHDFTGALDFVAPSCDAILRLMSRCEPFVLRYEDGFSSGRAGLREIAAFLERKPTDYAIGKITRALAPRAVASFIDDLARNGEFGDPPESSRWHKATHWHYDHLGDGAVGKYRDVMSAAEIDTANSRTRDFRAAFRYQDR